MEKFYIFFLLCYIHVNGGMNMNSIFVGVIGYLIGSISPSYFLGKLKGINVKENGSGNLGASNTVVLFGWKAGIFVAIHDILKAILAIVIARVFFHDVAYASEIAGVSCVVGHIFPFYLKFNGGKGFASYIGMMLALDFKLVMKAVVGMDRWIDLLKTAI